MNTQLVNYFRDEASKALGLLVDDYSYSTPETDVDDATGFATVTFKGVSIAVECILDLRDEDIDCKIVRVTAGVKARDYAVDDGGRRVREGLHALLRRGGVREILLHRVAGLSLEERIPITVRDFRTMLEKHGGDILADSPYALDG